MWTRGELKYSAKDALRNTYWWCFLFCIVAEAIKSVIAGVVSQLWTFLEIVFGISVSFSDKITNYSLPYIMSQLKNMAVYMPIWGTFGFLTGIIIFAFATGPINVGMKKFFLNISDGIIKFDNIGYGFTQRYSNVAKVSFFQQLFISLGSIIIIPGIIMTYQYYFVPYILAENPNIDYKRALSISKGMTMGHKFNIFVLQLSFVGWYILGSLLCFVGIWFVVPYFYATETQLYLTLRKNAISSGITSNDELNNTQFHTYDNNY